jgi:subtilisin family serine protease
MSLQRGRRRPRALIHIVLALVLATTMLPAGALAAAGREAQTGSEQAKIDARLLKRAQAAESGERLEAIFVLGRKAQIEDSKFKNSAVVNGLQRVAADSQAALIKQIEARGGRVLNSFWIQNMVLADVTPSAMESVAALPAVDRVIPNFKMKVLPSPKAGGVDKTAVEESTWGVERIGADDVQDGLGLNGSGVRVATLDTGVDIAHPELAGKMVTDSPGNPNFPGGWLEFNEAGQPISSTPHDSASHGTHVSGTIHGGDASDVQIGVAPGAEMMHGLVIPGGSGSFAQVAAGMQWAIDPFDATGSPAGEPADIVSMSLGAGIYSQEMIEPTRNIYFAGSFPSFAIGNEDIFGSCGVGSSSPGNVYEAVGVGATDIDDDVADFSCGELVNKSDWSDPPAEWPDSYMTPDISAPGVDVYSSVPGGDYGNNSGTSMATPHVSGTVALMEQARPGITVDQTLDALIDTSFFDDRHGADRPNSRFGHGRINAYDAVVQVGVESGIRGTITNASNGNPVADATVAVTQTGASVQTDDDGSYELRLQPGTYDLEISRFGYTGVNVDNVTVAENQFVTVDRALAPMPSGRITGTVTYAPSGHGVPGATVSVAGVPVDLSAETGADGTYVIEGVPAGTYQVEASAPQLPPPAAVEVTVVANEDSEADFAFERPSSVAVLGDTDNQLRDFLEGQGAQVEQVTWATLNVADYSAVIVNRPGDPGEAAFRAFLEATDAAGTGVVFLDTWSTSGNGVFLLNKYLGNPATRNTEDDTAIQALHYEVTTAHPVVEGFAVGERIIHDESSQYHDHAWFGGYTGEGRQVVALAGHDIAGNLGEGIGVQQRANNRHVLLSMHGASSFTGPEYWTDETAQVLMNSIEWVSPPADEPEARFALWDLTVNPETVLYNEPVTVRARIKNIGNLAGGYEATLLVNGEPEATRAVSLNPNGTTQVTFTVERFDVGTYNLQIGPLEGSFRVRAPLVTVNAFTLDGGGSTPAPMTDAQVALVADGSVLEQGTTDSEGEITFDSTESIADYSIVVRRDATEGHALSYLLNRHVTVAGDTSFDFRPHDYDTSQLTTNFTTAASRHSAQTLLSPDAIAPWAFGAEPGTTVVTPGQYTTRDIHQIDNLDSVWNYPSLTKTMNLSRPDIYEHELGGDLAVDAKDVRGQAAPDISFDWNITDAFGNALATVLETGPDPFVAGPAVNIDTIVNTLRASADREYLPRLRLFDPSGDDIRAGTVAWDQRPFEFELDPATVVPGEYTTRLQIDAGPWGDRPWDEGSLIVPARAIASDSVPAGSTFDVLVQFDAPLQSGGVSLTEDLPLGFDVVDFTASPEAEFDDASTWTWSDYEPGELVTLEYTVRADRRLTPGEYEIPGVVTAGTSERAVAGETTITVAPQGGALSVTKAPKVTEGHNRWTRFKVVLSKPSDAPVTVNFRTVDGTAKRGKDFVAKKGSVKFAPGTTGKTVKVRILNDRRAERIESLKLALTGPGGVALKKGEARGYIRDND